MQIYFFNKNGQFLYEEKAEIDPLETKNQDRVIYLMPPNATVVKPEINLGYMPVWNGKAWQQIEDHRGAKYWLPEDKYGTPAREMVTLGPLPEGATTTPPEMTEEEKQALALNQAKTERANAVSKITVEVDGMVFDGDEEAQTRIGRTIAAAVALGVDLNTETRTWVLADNTIATPTIKQLAEALRLAGDKQTELWTVPYEPKVE